MKAPERIWAGPAVGSKGAPTWDFNGMCPGDCDNDPSGLQYAEHATLYHHADIVTALQAEVDRLREALRWYADKAEDCNRHGSEGDAARDALAKDTGDRARAVLED